MKKSRFEKFNFRNGKTAKNRVVVPPMASQTAETLGHATSKTISHYKELASSGAGLVFVEYSFVHPSGRGEEKQLGIDTDEKIKGLAEISDAIRKAGALSGIQIVHVGGKTTAALAGGEPIGPSPIAVPVKGWQPEVPRQANLEDIQNLIGWYVEAAHRAHRAGFDFIELHAAHGYGFNQWLSPLTNKRQDQFGGTIMNRARLLFEVITEIKMQLPELLLAVRLPAQDHLDGGLAIPEMIWVVQRLQELGVDLIDVSSGLGGWRRTDNRTEQGYLVEDATCLKKNTDVPIIGVGGILDGTTIDQFLSEEKLDLAAVGRAILKDPRGWGHIHLRTPVPANASKGMESSLSSREESR